MQKQAEQKNHNESLRDWDASYKQGKQALPWDMGSAAPELVRYCESRDMPKNVLEVGCGTGTNALWMAERGASVVAIEVSPTAIELAKEKVGDAKNLKLKFSLSDITKEKPVPDASVDFVFDRGVFHVMPDEQSRETFIERVANALQDGGFWLCISGSADEFRPEGVGGPPQLTACELVEFAEKHFEVFHLKRILSAGPYNSEIVMWEVLYRKRSAR